MLPLNEFIDRLEQGKNSEGNINFRQCDSLLEDQNKKELETKIMEFVVGDGEEL